MTSWQDPPLTRREARERERQLQQKGAEAGQPTPQGERPEQESPAAEPPGVRRAGTAGPTPAGETPQIVTPPPPSSVPESPFAPPPASFTTPSAPPAPATPSRFAPRREDRPFAPPRPASPSADDDAHDASTPERTLTRRELRAMLANSGHDEASPEGSDGDSPAGSLRQPSPAIDRRPEPHQPIATAMAEEPAPATSPVGHWTRDLHTDDATRDEPFDQLLSRGAPGHTATTTNALILPTLPEGARGVASRPATGEVIVTGSVDLPRGLGATGAHPSAIDSSELDSFLEEVEDSSTGVAPVSAARAVSTQGPARDVITPPKKEGVNVPLVLAVTAGILALGVVGTLVVGYVLGAFG